MESAAWIVWTNVPITRRKSFYLVQAPNEEVVFRDRHFWPCVEYLRDNGIQAYEVRPSETRKADRVERLALRQECIIWQS